MAALLVAGLWADRRGRAFFVAGRSVVQQLDRLSRAIAAGDGSGVSAAYATSFQGQDLTPTQWRPRASRDHVRQLEWEPGATLVGQNAAVAAWLQYRASFTSIDELALHLEQIEVWHTDGAVDAIVRFEAIGTPHGAERAGIDRARFRLSLRPGASGPAITAASFVDGERSISDRAAFDDVADAAGVAFENRYYPPFLTEPQAFGMIRYGPGGITVVDVDVDGFHDLFVPDGVAARLLRNRGDGRFDDITASAGLSGLDGVSTAVFADYDNDGDPDAFVSRTYRPNQLFRNTGAGRFEDVTAGAGLGEDCCTTAASWFDYDNDGRLDLYVGRYLDPRTAIPTTFYARNGEPNQLYHNNGDGTFSNVTGAAGVGDPGLCLATVAGDYDDDGYPDLYVVNDFGRSTLYRNRRDGTFEDVTVAAGALAYGAGMNATLGDFDNDARLDLYTTDIRSEHAWFAEAPTVWRYMFNSWRQGVWMTDMPLYAEMVRQSGLAFVAIFKEMAMGNHLLRNRGDGTFEDVSTASGANPYGWFWGAALADFDNDGWQDLYAANGWVYNDRGTEIELDFLNNVVGEQAQYKTGRFFDPAYFGRQSWHGYERNRYLRNNGNGTFSELGRAMGVDLLTNSRGVAVADFWNRGVLDIAVAASADRHALLRNAGAAGHWLDVELVGTQTNRDGVGARVYATSAGRRQLREVVAGDGYGSQSTRRLHFGLGEASVVDELVVVWPRSGIRQRFAAVGVDRIVEIIEGRDGLNEKRYPGGTR